MATKKRWVWWLVGGAVTLVVAIPIGVYTYIHFIEPDPAPKLELSAPNTTVPDANTDATLDNSDPASIAGSYTVTDGSKGQYRVQEVLFGQDAEATGTTEDVTGSLTIEGTTATAADVTVDLTTVESGSGNRDSQFRGRIMNTDQFPTATFTLTEPLDFGTDPGVGKAVTVSATGDLTLHGVTKSVTFDLQAQRLDATTIEVLGEIPIHFPDYDIANPSGGPAQVGDDGTLEFLVRFAPS
jgi:polyisoprenoid-binding protein YceI